MARSANLSLDQTNLDECEADDDDVTTQRRLVRDDEEEETFIVGTMPGGRRTLRRGQEARRLDSELWEDFFGAELAFSMDMSLSMPAGTAGKSGKAKSGGKSGKGSKVRKMSICVVFVSIYIACLCYWCLINYSSCDQNCSLNVCLYHCSLMMINVVVKMALVLVTPSTEMPRQKREEQSNDR